jgi:hypothetical protein
MRIRWHSGKMKRRPEPRIPDARPGDRRPGTGKEGSRWQ